MNQQNLQSQIQSLSDEKADALYKWIHIDDKSAESKYKVKIEYLDDLIKVLKKEQQRAVEFIDAVDTPEQIAEDFKTSHFFEDIWDSYVTQQQHFGQRDLNMFLYHLGWRLKDKQIVHTSDEKVVLDFGGYHSPDDALSLFGLNKSIIRYEDKVLFEGVIRSKYDLAFVMNLLQFNIQYQKVPFFIPEELKKVVDYHDLFKAKYEAT